MKKAIKILLIVGIVLHAISIFYNVFQGFGSIINGLHVIQNYPESASLFIVSGVIFFVAVVLNIIGIILGVIIYKKFPTFKTKSEMLVWSVITLILVSFIAGLLMILIKEEDLGDPVGENLESTPTEAKADSVNDNSYKEHKNAQVKDVTSDLTKLKELFDSGVLTEEEYKAKKEEIIKRLQ